MHMHMHMCMCMRKHVHARACACAHAHVHVPQVFSLGIFLTAAYYGLDYTNPNNKKVTLTLTLTLTLTAYYCLDCTVPKRCAMHIDTHTCISISVRHVHV